MSGASSISSGSSSHGVKELQELSKTLGAAGVQIPQKGELNTIATIVKEAESIGAIDSTQSSQFQGFIHELKETADATQLDVGNAFTQEQKAEYARMMAALQAAFHVKLDPAPKSFGLPDRGDANLV